MPELFLQDDALTLKPDDFTGDDYSGYADIHWF
jgi:hypothetical protein